MKEAKEDDNIIIADHNNLTIIDKVTITNPRDPQLC